MNISLKVNYFVKSGFRKADRVGKFKTKKNEKSKLFIIRVFYGFIFL